MKSLGGGPLRGEERVASPDASDELVRRAKAGDAHAFAALIRELDPRMRRLASGLVADAAAVDDVLQDAYLQAYRGLQGFRGDAAFSTWLYTLVYRTCVRLWMHRERRAEVRLTAGDDFDTGADHTEEHALADEIERALRALPITLATTVILVDGDGCSYAEAARVLGVREGTVASRLNRGRRALRRQLGHHIDESRRSEP